VSSARPGGSAVLAPKYRVTYRRTDGRTDGWMDYIVDSETSREPIQIHAKCGTVRNCFLSVICDYLKYGNKRKHRPTLAIHRVLRLPSYKHPHSRGAAANFSSELFKRFIWFIKRFASLWKPCIRCRRADVLEQTSSRNPGKRLTAEFQVSA